MDALSVFRMDGSDPRLLGRINLDPVTFSYDPGYLADPDARAVSCSLPLRNGGRSRRSSASSPTTTCCCCSDAGWKP